jgi:hypothetical protein
MDKYIAIMNKTAIRMDVGGVRRRVIIIRKTVFYP